MRSILIRSRPRSTRFCRRSRSRCSRSIPRFPSSWFALSNRALAKPRDERYQHMSEMLLDLAVFRQQLAGMDSPATGRMTPTVLRTPSGRPYRDDDTDAIATRRDAGADDGGERASGLRPAGVDAASARRLSRVVASGDRRSWPSRSPVSPCGSRRGPTRPSRRRLPPPLPFPRRDRQSKI